MKKQSLHGTPGAGTRDMVQVALFAALIVALAFLPFIGYIPLGFTKATTIHIPVIIGSILLGPQKGAVLGGVFGLTSLINNTLYPTATSFVFSPFYSAGAFKGGWASLIICFVPRILVGVTPGWSGGCWSPVWAKTVPAGCSAWGWRALWGRLPTPCW